MYRLFSLLALILFVESSSGQSFSEADTLRGMLSPVRTCYDVKYYHLNIKVIPEEKTISGSNLIRFIAMADFRRMQIDLFENLRIDKIVYNKQTLPYTRKYNAVFVDFPQTITKGLTDQFTVYYSGKPVIAKNAPWDGGFIFTKDNTGKPWISVACQELGASAWWPNKDHQSDEPDSMLISVVVPEGLMNISNGQLRSTKRVDKGFTEFNWFVSSPINNYSVTLNIGDYVKFDEIYQGEKGNLSLDYYVLRNNIQKAKAHFPGDVKTMLKCFEYWFGAYPFYQDGYKLVETPYLGMENQSAIAYGNRYMKGYRGMDLSGTGLGLTWDYIIIHESGHEWFGNNITSKDIADMWIHESFTTYAEGLFVESTQGKAAGANYITGLRRNIQNKSPILGYYHVNNKGSADMYYKGANMLHTIRSIIDDDVTWRNILRGLNKHFGLKTTTTEEVISYINHVSGKNLTKVFDQYLRFSNIPVLEVKQAGKNTTLYRLKADVPDLEMPVRIKLQPNDPDWKTLRANSKWKKVKSSALVVDTSSFYIKTSFLP